MARKKFAAAAAVAGMIVLAACSGGSGDGAATSGGAATSEAAGEAPSFNPDEKVQLSFTWWGNDDRAARYNEAVDLFEAKYPNVTVTRNFNSWADYWTVRNTEAAGRALPDVMQTDISYISQYGDQGLFLDLDPYLDTVINVEGYSENLLASGSLGDEVVGIPISTTTLAIHYNKDLLDSLGVDYPSADMTWDDFDDYIVEVNEAGGTLDPSVFGMADYVGGFPAFVYHLMQEGKEVYTEEGGAAFTEEDVVNWLDRSADLRDNDGFFPIDRQIAITPLTPYTSGQAALSIEWSTMISNATADLGTDNLGLVQPPFGSDDSARGLSEKPGMLLSVAANSKNPAAAAALVDFLANDPEVIAIFGTSRGVPATEAGRAAVDPTPADTIVIDYLESITDDITEAYPTVPSGEGTLQAKWTELNEELQYGAITSEEFASALFEEIETSLGK